VTKEQTARAREIPVLDYVLRYEGDSFKSIGGGFRSKEHKSLAISDKGFFWHSNGVGGKTALDYLMTVKNYDFVSAVCHLINEAPYEKGDKPNRKKKGRSPPNSQSHKPQSTSTAAANSTNLPSSQNKPKPDPQNITLPRRKKTITK